ncbi:hypothetical protein KR018_000015, partial [Drosophila ironensis]
WVDQHLFEDILDRDFPELKNVKEFKLDSVGGKGENYTTLLLRATFELELKDGSQKSTSYLAKLLPNTSTRDEVSTWKVFEKEHNTYANYIPEFEKMYRDAGKEVSFAPTYYATKKPQKKELIVLEDLGRRGFRNVNRHKGLDMDHTEAVLEKLAQFHAASALRFEQKGAYPAVYDRNLCSQEDNFADFRNSQVKALIETLPLYEASHVAKSVVRKKKQSKYRLPIQAVCIFVQEAFGKQAQDMFQAYAPRIEGEFCVLNHGDAWCNNFMFQYDEAGKLKETYFVDLQMSRYSSPAQDLLYFILSSTQIEIKIAKFDQLVRFYHEKLVENLKLLKYSKQLPSLRSLHRSLITHGDWSKLIAECAGFEPTYAFVVFSPVFPIVTVLMPVVLLDSSDDANMDTMMDSEAAGDKLRNNMFKNTRIIRHQKEVIPWAFSRGAFEVTN